MKLFKEPRPEDFDAMRDARADTQPQPDRRWAPAISPGKVTLTSRIRRPVFRDATPGAELAPDAADKLERAARHAGSALPEALRRRFEGALGAELSAVRVHDDPQAWAAAEALRARAFTVGQDVYFAEGAYGPDTAAGARLLAHELMHTVQQRQLDSSVPRADAEVLVSEPGDAAEREAEQFASSYMNHAATSSELPEGDAGWAAALGLAGTATEHPSGAVASPAPRASTAPAPVIYRQDEESPQSAQEQQPTPEQAQDAERAAALSDMTRGAGLSEGQHDAIRIALRAFSPAQLDRMQRAGVRFWPEGSLPPAFHGLAEAARLRTPARYLAQIRTIQMRSRVPSSSLRHELAHAWDHVRALPGRELVRLDEVETARRRQLIDRRARLASERNPRVRQMYEAFLRLRLPRDHVFNSSAAEEGYARASIREFYAEGYAVFHGSSAYQQAFLLRYAADFYDFLEQEAREQGMPVPDRAAVRAAEPRLFSGR